MLATPLAEAAALSGNPIAATVAGAVQAADSVTDAAETAAAAPKATGVSVAAAALAAVAAVPEVAAHPQADSILSEVAAFFSGLFAKL